LITEGVGYIGSHYIVELLSKTKISIIILNNLVTDHKN